MLCSILLCLTFVAPSNLLTAADTTVVVWDRQRIDYSYRVDFTRIEMPDARQQYKRITMTYTLECPRFGCDPWDRVGEVFILDSAQAAPYSTDDLNPLFFDVQRYELGRFVTAYGKGWTWEFDVSHLRSLMHDSVTLGTYVSVFKETNHHGDPIGYLASMSLHFEEGEPDFIATGVDLLWRGNFLYGIPDDPIEDHLTPITVEPTERFAVARVTASGHGQGNTDNAGEFARKLHTLNAGSATFAHYLWRDDCHMTQAGEQYGSWDLPRAGFCPGSKIYPWVNDVSSFYRPGSDLTLDYDVEPYENRCRPDVEPCPCDDCEYNDLGHTKPEIAIDGQIIYYRIPPSTSAVRNAFTLHESDSREVVTLVPNLDEPSDVAVTVLNALGTIVYYQFFRDVVDRPIRVDLATVPGRYQLKAETSEGTYRTEVNVAAD